MEQAIAEIANKSGFTIMGLRAISGGDISQSFCVSTSTGKLMLKLYDAIKCPGMFERESEGLQALADARGLKVPSVVGVGLHHQLQYLWLEWMETGTPTNDFWEQFALGLGKIHTNTNARFGWHRNNYIGSLEQSNSWMESWGLFYGSQRIMPLVKILYNSKGLGNNDVKNAEALCNRLPGLFPVEPPALLHGDLWSGNFLPVIERASAVVPAVFDPAVYFGHREMDLGMSLLFGGFDRRFYECYESGFKLDKQWRTRVSLTQLYPLLVHAVLFGGSYLNRCRLIMDEWK